MKNILLSVIAVGTIGAMVACGEGKDDSGSPSTRGTNSAGSGGTGGGSKSSGGSGGKGSGGTNATGGTGPSSGGTSAAGAGGASSQSGDVSFGVPESTELGAMTAEQLKQLCDAEGKLLTEGEYADLGNKVACFYAGLFAAGEADVQTDEELRTACKKAFDECMAEPLGECSPYSAECKTTVGQLEQCYEDNLPTLRQLVQVLPTCETTTMADLEKDPGESIPEPASCASLGDACPDFRD